MLGDLPRIARFARWVFGLVVGLAVAGIAAYLLGVKPREVIHYGAAASPWVLAGCAASSLMVLAFQALRWHAVMAPVLSLRYRDAFRAQAVGYMFNALLPVRGGDLLRVQYLGRRTGKSRSMILGTEIVDRWLDFWGWIPSFAVMCLVTSPPRWLYHALALLGGGLALWALVMVALTRSGYVPRPGSRFAGIYAAFKSGIEAFATRRTWFIAFFIAPLSWLWEHFVLMIAAHGFGIELSPVMAFSVLIGFNLAMLVPSPGAIGTTEAGGTAALVVCGVDQSQALAFMLVYHAMQLLPGIALGAGVLATEGRRLVTDEVVAPEQAA